LLEFLTKLEDTTSCFPTSDDLTGAASALLRLQDVYALKTEQIAKGRLRGVKNSPELSGRELFYLEYIDPMVVYLWSVYLWQLDSIGTVYKLCIVSM